MTTSAPLPKDHPIMIAWEKYKASDQYANAFQWAQNVDHRDGSMWNAFLAGFDASYSKPLSPAPAGVADEGEVVAWRAPINPHGQPSFTYTRTEEELVRFGHHQREPLVRQSALTACQQEVETLREGIKEIAERERGIRDNWVRHEAETGARIFELEADLEVANDKLRKMVKALASVTHQLRGWQPEEVALDSDLMEDAPAIERALRVLGRAER